MKKKKKNEVVSGFLGPDSRIEGDLEFSGTIRLDGHLRGKINSGNGTVIIGETAVIHADISVDAAIIMGKVNGTIEAGDRIEVYPPGCVNGDIYAPMISIDSGATFNGNCGMKSGKIPAAASSDVSGDVSGDASGQIFGTENRQKKR